MVFRSVVVAAIRSGLVDLGGLPFSHKGSQHLGDGGFRGIGVSGMAVLSYEGAEHLHHRWMVPL
jgi:hypothetical protein